MPEEPPDSLDLGSPRATMASQKWEKPADRTLERDSTDTDEGESDKEVESQLVTTEILKQRSRELRNGASKSLTPAVAGE